MSKTRTLIIAVCSAFGLTVHTAAMAALIDRGGGRIYDTDLNVTWMADANFARTSGYSAGGYMSWDGAMAWASNLVFVDSVNNVVYDDWRLPITQQPDPSCSAQQNDGIYGVKGYAYGCTGSEMGHLFYRELGGVAGQNVGTTHDEDYGLFTNLNGYRYWSATVEASANPGSSYTFDFFGGHQNTSSQGNVYLAWAVRSGDVLPMPLASAPVPVPAAVWLFGSGLLGLIGVARRRSTI